MMKEIIKKFAVIFCLSVFIAIISVTDIFSDTIKLRSGREITGRLKEINDKDVVLYVGAGTIWFAKEQVESINGLSLEEAEATLSTRKAFILRDKDKALSSSAKEGFAFIAKTRELEFKTEPPIEVIPKSKLKERIKQAIEKQHSKDKLNIRAKLLVKLGLISKIEEYSSKVLELLTEEVAGYYDTEEKKIYIDEASLGLILPGVPSIILMHEQVHALQDQHYNLKSLEENIISSENEDSKLAIQSIIEGEATVLMYDASLRSLAAGEKTKFFDLRSFVIDSMLAFSKRVKTIDGKPAIFVEDLLFPFVWGGSFIQYLVNTKGWESVDALYKDMPLSSEQIMHPEKYYIMRDEPKKVELPDLSAALGNSYTCLINNTLGEFGFYLIGKTFLDELECKLMSEGWGGDSFALFEEPNTKQLIFICTSRWDTEQDAQEFFQFYKKIIEKKYKQAALNKEGLDSYQWKTEGGYVHISKTKDTVIIIEGADEKNIPGLLDALII